MSARIDAYRIGGGPRHGDHWAHRWHVDRWLRSWQAEVYDADFYAWMWCPRSWTEAGVLRRARRWLRNGTDIRKHEARYGPRPDLHRRRQESLGAAGGGTPAPRAESENREGES